MSAVIGSDRGFELRTSLLGSASVYATHAGLAYYRAEMAAVLRSITDFCRLYRRVFM